MEKSPEKKEYKVTNIEEIKRRLAQEFDVEKIKNEEGNIEEKEEKNITIEDEKAMIEEIEREKRLIQAQYPQLQNEADKKAQEIEKLDIEGKLRGLLDMAQTKSIPFAITAARALNDPYVLDVFHDLLVKKGLYRKLSL